MNDPVWSLVQYRRDGSSSISLGVLTGATVRIPPSNWPDTTLALLDHWDDFSEDLRQLKWSELEPIADVVLAAPITYPRKVICAGANFFSHAAEMGTPEPDPSAPPFFFLKPPTTTVIGPNEVAPFPHGDAPKYDWEGELGIVIGARAKDVSARDAQRYIAGYVVANDLSARGRFTRPFAAEPFAWDWLGQKCQDGSCPLGPGIVPSWLVPDIATSSISLAVNGEIKQNSTMGDIVVGIDDLVSRASHTLTLEPGDVILAGTPAGVGMPRNTFLQPGDVVEVSIDGLGTLRTPIGR